MKPRILVIIEGGVVQGIFSNTEIETVVVDFDNETDIVSGISKEDGIFKSENAYKVIKPLNTTPDKIEQEVIESLKELKF